MMKNNLKNLSTQELKELRSQIELELDRRTKQELTINTWSLRVEGNTVETKQQETSEFYF